MSLSSATVKFSHWNTSNHSSLGNTMGHNLCKLNKIIPWEWEDFSLYVLGFAPLETRFLQQSLARGYSSGKWWPCQEEDVSTCNKIIVVPVLNYSPNYYIPRGILIVLLIVSFLTSRVIENKRSFASMQNISISHNHGDDNTPFYAHLAPSC